MSKTRRNPELHWAWSQFSSYPFTKRFRTLTEINDHIIDLATKTSNNLPLWMFNLIVQTLSLIHI